MVDHKGTGNKLGELDLGPFGTYVIEDDGDPDPYVWIDMKNNATLADNIRNMRRNKGDEAVLDAIEALNERFSDEPASTSDESDTQSFERSGPFVCDNCGRTWPNKSNQTPDTAGTNICPDCS